MHPEGSEELKALRLVFAKLVELEKKIDLLSAPAAQAQMKMKAGSRPVNPMHALLQGRMLAEWMKVRGNRYEFHPRDAKAIASLLKRAMPMDEMVARWTFAFKNGCDSIFIFDMNFNKWSPSLQSTRPQVDGGTDLYSENP